MGAAVSGAIRILLISKRGRSLILGVGRDPSLLIRFQTGGWRPAPHNRPPPPGGFNPLLSLWRCVKSRALLLDSARGASRLSLRLVSAARAMVASVFLRPYVSLCFWRHRICGGFAVRFVVAFGVAPAYVRRCRDVSFGARFSYALGLARHFSSPSRNTLADPLN